MEREIIIVGGFLASNLAYLTYKIEQNKFESKKDFWKFKVQGGLLSFKGFIDVIIWDLIILAALPAGVIWRLASWTTKNSKN